MKVLNLNVLWYPPGILACREYSGKHTSSRTCLAWPEILFHASALVWQLG